MKLITNRNSCTVGWFYFSDYLFYYHAVQKIGLDEQCQPHDQCVDTHADCTNSTVGQPARCLCQPGYFNSSQTCGLLYTFTNARQTATLLVVCDARVFKLVGIIGLVISATHQMSRIVKMSLKATWDDILHIARVK